MRFNISQLLQEETGASRDHHVVEAIEGIDEDLDLRAPLEGDIRLIRTDRGVLVQGALSTSWALTCGRCLDDFEQSVSMEIEEEFEATLDGSSRSRGGSAPESFIDSYHIVDLTESVRQALLVELPISPTCREACAGLCPVCGLNLNAHPSHRHARAIDPRLSVLRDLVSGSA